MRGRWILGLAVVGLAASAVTCAASSDSPEPGNGTGTATGTATGDGAGGGGGTNSGGVGGAPLTGGFGTGGCGPTCSTDMHQVLGCNGQVIETCTGTDACDPQTGTCTNACDVAVSNKQSVGCEYYATMMDILWSDVCFAVFVANTWNSPVHITVERAGSVLPIESFTRIPQGTGPSLTYGPYDATAGLPAGEVAILFLSGTDGPVDIPHIRCPVPSAIPSGVKVNGTGTGESFHISTDVPVVAYQMLPYGGGASEITDASLLLPTSAWDTNYIAANAYAHSPGSAPPSMNIVALADQTKVTMVPVAAVEGGGVIPAGPANVPLEFFLDEGQHAQISQSAELTGSVIDADKPIGVMAGHQCMYLPVDVYTCDHGEAMIPPVQQLGSEYVGVMHRSRNGGEPALWRLVGAVDGTELSWSNAVGGPASIDQGQVIEFLTAEAFVVNSQDEDHPFMLFAHMVGNYFQPSLQGGYGDPDTVLSVPTNQYMTRYVFFTDPTYPETNLVVVRRQHEGQFHDVTLDCAGVLDGWQPVGDYEWTRVDLITGDFQPVGSCSTGRREMTSDGTFGLWVWGWGTPETTTKTSYVSYGYPAGMNVQPINEVVVPPVPK